jgi:hypothetical protein
MAARTPASVRAELLTRAIGLPTTILDPRDAPAAMLAHAYHQRPHTKPAKQQVTAISATSLVALDLKWRPGTSDQ